MPGRYEEGSPKMQILSAAFLLLLLPLGLGFYWLVFRQPRGKLWFLLLFSYGFYLLADGWYLPLLLGLALLTYWLAGKRLYWLGIVFNLGALAAFKLLGAEFGLLARGLAALHIPFEADSLQLAVPLGLSYYVFKHISYLVDVHKGRIAKGGDLLAFLTYGALFAEVSAGPISSFRGIGAQLRDLPKTLSRDHAVQGMLHIGMGIAKKVLLAESLAAVLSLDIYKPAGPNNGLLNIWLMIVLQGLYLYLDFSGYTDIALGLGYLFGLTLPPNFNSPYLSVTPNQFWERWHISLSQWFRVYLFSPLSRWMLTRFGSKTRLVSQAAASIITMTLVGVWHGFSPGFILWGAYHGVLLSLQAWAERRKFRWVNTWINQALTLVAVFAGWVFFFSTGTLSLWYKLQSMAGLHGLGELGTLFSQIAPENYVLLLVAGILGFSRYTEAAQVAPAVGRRVWLAALVGLLLALTLLLLGQPVDFTYVQF